MTFVAYHISSIDPMGFIWIYLWLSGKLGKPQNVVGVKIRNVSPKYEIEI